MRKFLIAIGIGAAFFAVSTVRGDARAEEPKDEPKPWCAPELETLAGDVCFHAEPAHSDGGKRTLVIFLHGLVKDGAGWQHAQQRGLVRAGKRLGFSVLAPRGVLGASPKYGDDMIAWPTSPAAQEKYEAGLLADWQHAREEIEARDGAFDEVFVVGFSNGAYYATSLAMRAPIAVDGYAVFAGGSPYQPQLGADSKERKPLFVAICSKDDTTVKDARKLVRTLKKHRWPHKAESRKVGHAIADVHIDHAFAYLRATKKGS